MLWWGRERKARPVCSLSFSSAKHPNPRSRNHERPRIHAKPRRPPEHGGEENGWLLFTHLKPKAEGYETEILTKLHSNHKTACVNPKHIIYLSVRVIASDESRTRHGGIALLHRNHEVGEVSGRCVSKGGKKKAVSRIWKSPDADHRKTAASSAHFGIYTAKKPLVEFRRARVAGLVVPIHVRASQRPRESTSTSSE